MREAVPPASPGRAAEGQGRQGRQQGAPEKATHAPQRLPPRHALGHGFRQIIETVFHEILLSSQKKARI
jgi:hypothetical protein